MKMIEWKEYDPVSREIESHTNHLITNGHRTLIAQHASVPGTGKYSWMINNTLIDWVTHYAKINLPTKGVREKTMLQVGDFVEVVKPFYWYDDEPYEIGQKFTIEGQHVGHNFEAWVKKVTA